MRNSKKRKSTMAGLEEVFNTEKTPKFDELEGTIEKTPEVTLPVKKEESMEEKILPTLEDSDYLRTQLKLLIKRSQSALDVIVDSVQESEIVRGAPFEAIAKLTDAIAKAISKLTELSSKEKDNEYKGKHGEIGTINNNLYLGTAEVLKLIGDNKRALEDGTFIEAEIVDTTKE